MFSFNIRGTVYTARTLAGVSAAYCKARDESGEGASTFPFPMVSVIERGTEVFIARLSYNGRIWRNYDFEEGSTPLYDPAADPVPDMLAAFNAITARIAGDFDNPALLAFGPLSEDMAEDLQFIAATATKKAESALT